MLMGDRNDVHAFGLIKRDKKFLDESQKIIESFLKVSNELSSKQEEE